MQNVELTTFLKTKTNLKRNQQIPYVTNHTFNLRESLSLKDNFVYSA